MNVTSRISSLWPLNVFTHCVRAGNKNDDDDNNNNNNNNNKQQTTDDEDDHGL